MKTIILALFLAACTPVPKDPHTTVRSNLDSNANPDCPQCGRWGCPNYASPPDRCEYEAEPIPGTR